MKFKDYLRESSKVEDMITNADKIELTSTKDGYTVVYILWNDNSDAVLKIKKDKIVEKTGGSLGGIAKSFIKNVTDKDVKYILTSAKYK